jgi:hypothetical protein
MKNSSEGSRTVVASELRTLLIGDLPGGCHNCWVPELVDGDDLGMVNIALGGWDIRIYQGIHGI